MTTTQATPRPTVDPRTPAQRHDDTLDKLRRPLRAVVDWTNDTPVFVTFADCQRIVERHVGHEVDPADLHAAMVLVAADSDRCDAALDALLDVTVCDGCEQPFDSEAPAMPECPHGDWCSQSCFSAWHGGNYCSAVGL